MEKGNTRWRPPSAISIRSKLTFVSSYTSNCLCSDFDGQHTLNRKLVHERCKMSDQRLGLRAAREPNSSSRQQVAGGGEEGWLLPPCQWKVGYSIDHGVKSDNEWGEEQCWSGHRERMLIATVDAIACRPRHSLFPTSPWANSVSLFYNFLEERMEIKET